MDSNQNIINCNESFMKMFNIELKQSIRTIFTSYECNELLTSTELIEEDFYYPKMDKRFLVSSVVCDKSTQFLFQDLSYMQEFERNKESQRAEHLSKKVDQAVTKVIKEISHEINNPLTNLYGIFVNIQKALEQNDLNKEDLHSLVKKGIKEVSLCGKRLKIKSDSIYTSTKEINYNDIDLMSLIENLKEDFSEKIRLGSVELNYAFLGKVALKSNYASLRFCLSELLQNSLDFYTGSDKCHIDIQFVNNEQESSIIYKDNGEPLTLYDNDQVFEPYYSTKESSSGAGIGLYRVRKILNDLNADIKYINESSSFKITFRRGSHDG